MTVLTQHRPEATHLPEKPLQDFGAPATVGGDELASFFRQIEHDGAALEQADRLAAAGRFGVDDCRDAVVGGNGKEFGFELLARADADRVDAVFDARFFKHHRYLHAIGRGPAVQFNHRQSAFSYIR